MTYTASLWWMPLSHCGLVCITHRFPCIVHQTCHVNSWSCHWKAPSLWWSSCCEEKKIAKEIFELDHIKFGFKNIITCYSNTHYTWRFLRVVDKYRLNYQSNSSSHNSDSYLHFGFKILHKNCISCILMNMGHTFDPEWDSVTFPH